MSKKEDNFTQEEYALEEILAEFSTRPPKEGVDPIPSEDLSLPEEPEASPEEETPAPPEEPVRRSRAARPEPPAPPPEEEKVIPFPGAGPLPESDPPSLLEEGMEKLRRKADDFADRMFENEGVETSEATLRAETLIPGVDEEKESPPSAPRRRKPVQLPPDLPLAQLHQHWSKGLSSLRLRSTLVLLLCLPQLWLLLAGPLSLPLPPLPGDTYAIQVYASGILFAAAALLGCDVWGQGLVNLFRGRPGMDTLLGFSVLTAAVDCFTMPLLAPRDGQLPYGCVVSLALFFSMRGVYLKRRGLRITCKTAASAQEPYLVTLDPARWNGQASYTKHPGTPHGFGSQLQTEDGAQLIYRRITPVLMAACILLSLLASLGKGEIRYLPWCLAATFTASAAFGGLLSYSKPFFSLAKRLAACGAALGGWEGIRESGRGILLSDNDLFPPGTVTINGIKVFGDISIEKVLSLTATLIRESGSGLDRIFGDLLRSHGGKYRPCTGFARYEGGGMSATVWGEQILVGSASFMTLMEVPLPQGLKVKNAVFCAVNGELAGIFALNYSLHSAISPALYALIQNKISPVLATRDFNIIPSMLQQRFKLPVEKMDYPPVERRVDLSDPEQDHNPILTALLCREGLAPLSEAVVGGQRLRRATLLAAGLVCLGAALGVGLSFYLLLCRSFYSLSPINLLIFQLMWLVPTYLIAGWVNKY